VITDPVVGRWLLASGSKRHSDCQKKSNTQEQVPDTVLGITQAPHGHYTDRHTDIQTGRQRNRCSLHGRHPSHVLRLCLAAATWTTIICKRWN